MESLYVIEPGCYLRREGATLNICRGKKVVDRIPADGLKRLMLVGYVSLTGGVLDHLVRHSNRTPVDVNKDRRVTDPGYGARMSRHLNLGADLD